mgnify:CR=1 FL=1|jgi:hypothetical protein
MSTETNTRPLIIKRKKVSAGDGHHGGAWKVAMLSLPSMYRRRFRAQGHRVGSDPSNRHSDACGPLAVPRHTKRCGSDHRENP